MTATTGTTPTLPPSGSGMFRGLGLVATTALVVGNMIGSGIYVIPSSLAETAGPLGLVAWAINAAGYLCLTAVFADLGGAYPVSGGLQAFARRAFGDLVGLEVGFLYWLCAVIGNAAFLTAFVGYLAVLWPAAGDPWTAFVVSQALLWALTLTNAIGVRAGGAIQVVTVICKLAPLVILSVALWPLASLEHVQPFAPKGWGSLLPAVSLVSWLFVGMESVTVPAEEIRGAGRTIRKSVYIGFAMTCVVYLLVLGSLSLAVPAELLAKSASPLADVAAHHFGPTAATLVTVGALVSVAGILNGWVLVTSRMAHATARDGLGPRALAQLHPRFGTPTRALVLTAVLSGALVGLYFSGSTLEIYNFIALLSTATALVAIGAACAAQLRLLRREPDRFSPQQHRRAPWTASIGLAVVVLMIAGSGATIVALTAACLLLPLPYYFFALRRRPAGAAK
ncbi:APC family permease [Nannocystis bainbridge]|uniref:Arginine/agmatine antiporter n=1 Tax=Nannocystis bainbridge TaxID=2995303 RepID=A0ABT5DX53_9BACT|nr:amino acid permease [Nannocystis bainbridge]MDC0717684.1 amino acid permease [Nannocystis bainbridge]